MATEPNPDKDKERTLNFALLIRQRITSKGIEFNMQSKNQGIADSDVILAVEAWLDKIKSRYKDNMTKGMTFGDDKKN